MCVLLYFKTRSPYVGQGSLELSIPSLPSAEVTGVHHHVRLVSFGVKTVGFVLWKSTKVACKLQLLLTAAGLWRFHLQTLLRNKHQCELRNTVVSFMDTCTWQGK